MQGRETPLHEAAKEGSLEVVKLLLDKGAEVNAKDNVVSYHDTA